MSALEAALRKVLAQHRVVADLASQSSAREDESQKIFDDQQRLRGNIKALKGSAEEKALLQRYTKQLDAQESRLEALRKEQAEIEARQGVADAELTRMIQELVFDVKL
jgi:DNA repair exonuclease SbcCD ATPase subunit